MVALIRPEPVRVKTLEEDIEEAQFTWWDRRVLTIFEPITAVFNPRRLFNLPARKLITRFGEEDVSIEQLISVPFARNNKCSLRALLHRAKRDPDCQRRHCIFALGAMYDSGSADDYRVAYLYGNKSERNLGLLPIRELVADDWLILLELRME